MKKLTTILILVFIVSAGLFANPKIPRYVIPYDEVIPYLYVSNDCQNIYEIYIGTNKANTNFQLRFFNKSLILPTSIFLEVDFSSEKKLEDFIKDIDLSDLETSFKNTRQKLIRLDITPDIFLYGKKEYHREIDNTEYGYGYNEQFDFQTLPSQVIYRATF